MNHYPHHIGDFDRATRHLSRIERSVYRDLIDLYYDTEQQLTLDKSALCRKILARSNEESTAVEQVLNEFFNETPSGWYHDRCEAEIERYRANNTQKAQAGKASAAAKALKTERAMNARANGVSTDVEQAFNGTPTNQEPRTKNQFLIKPNGLITPSSVINPEPLKNKTTALVKTTVGETELQAACRETWGAYCLAYAARYAVDPVRNAPVNAQIRQFVQRIGAAESPQVAAYYVQNNAAFYVKKMHSVGMLLADAEKLRTEWATNKRVTDTEARQADKTQAIGGVFQELIEEARERSATAA